MWLWAPPDGALVAPSTKNLLAMQETQVLSLGREYPLEREWLPTPVFLPGESQGKGAWWATVVGSHRVRHE